MDDNVGLYDLLGSEILPCTGTTVIDLPPPDTKRWVARRKAVVVNAVRSGAISLEEVCRRYELSVEEFLAWQRAIETHGVAGLRVTRLQIYRDTLPLGWPNPATEPCSLGHGGVSRPSASGVAGLPRPACAL